MGHKKNFFRNRQGFDLSALIFYVQTNASGGVSANDQFTIPILGTASYNYDVETSDGQSFTGQTGSLTITFPSIGFYYVSITGTFPRIYFNNGGDDGKVVKVINFGTIAYSTDITAAFHGCTNLNELLFLNDDFSYLNSAVNGTNAFMAADNLGALREGVTLASLTNGTNMFRLAKLPNFPSTVTLASLTTGFRMFESCGFTTTPDGMSLDNVTDGRFMFLSNPLTDFGTSLRLDSLTLGAFFTSISNINGTRYSQLLVDLDAHNPNNTVTLAMSSAAHNKNQVDSGTTDGTTANKLVDSTQNFLTTVNIGDAVRNTTDSTWALVTNVDSDTQLTLDNDIMVSGEAYKIYDDDGTKAKANLVGNRAWTITDGTTY